MNKYRVIAGSHKEGHRSFSKGDVFVSPFNLTRLFAGSFENLGEATQQEVIAAGLGSRASASRIVTTPAGLEINGGLISFSNLGASSIVLQGATAVGLNLLFQDDLISVSAPDATALEAASQIVLRNNPALVSVSFPSLTTLVFGDVVDTPLLIESNPVLTTISLGNVVIGDGVSLSLYGNALSQASVDHILARCVASTGFVSGTVDLSGGTTSPPSSVAPGSDYDIVTQRGVTVNVNS